jgi:hypothetical protein
VEREPKRPATKTVLPPLPRLGQLGFLRSLLTLGCLWLPLILLDSASGQGVGATVAKLGYLILGVVWLIQLLRRLEDAGYPLLGRGLSLLLLVVIARGLRLFSFLHRSQDPFELYSELARFLPKSPAWTGHTNGYEILGLFLVVQAPLAALPSKLRSYEPPPRRENKYGKQLAEWRKKHKPFLVGRFAFLRRLLVIAVLWLPLIYIDSVSKGGIGTWSARFGYFVLTYAWLINSRGRFEDVGWSSLPDHWQYCLVVSVATLMPLAIHWVDGYGALAIFVLIQIPIAFPGSKPNLPDSATS